MQSHTVKLNISYDGTRFFGWQKTKTGCSIQEELEQALAKILGRPISTEAASRTDRGVHARGQIVHFHIDLLIDAHKLKRGLNSVLPSDIRVNSVEIADFSFHATLSALSKEYWYLICNAPVQFPAHRLYSWHIHSPLDLNKMKQAALHFQGSHDFSALTNQRSDHPLTCGDAQYLRTLESVSIESIEDSRLCIRLRGNRFLYKMARNIVGTLVAIGTGKLAPDGVSAILDSKDRKQAGPTAPAHGLFLMQVFYT